MSKKNYWLLFSLIIFIAVLLRFYKLGSVPHGMTWDEAAIGYNGYSVLTTRRDEWLKFLPFSFWSFGDYKAPAAIYINGLFTFIFGMNLFAVRLPFAIFSIFAVAGTMLLTKELFSNFLVKSKVNPKILSIISGILITFSPWHLHYSRAGFESGMSLSLLVWGLLSLFWWQENKYINKLGNVVSMILPSTFFAASMYTYHSAKIVVPLLILVSFIIFYKNFIKKKLFIFANFITGAFYLLPMAYDSFFGHGLERSETLIYSRESDFFIATKMVIDNFLSHFSIDFLIKGHTDTLRHGSGGYGVLFIIPLLFIVTAVSAFLFNFFSKKHKISREKTRLFALAFLWIFIGILPAALGTEAPHSNRAFLAYPGFLFLTILGVTEGYSLLYKFTKKLKDKKQIIKATAGTILLVYFLVFISYLHHYYNVFAKESADAFMDGYLEAFEYVIPYEKGENGKQQVDKIVFTSEYGQPYIYALFARKTNPIYYQGGSLIKYEFREDVSIGDLSRNNTAIVAGKNSEFLHEERADKLIYGSDGEVRFKIYITPNEQ